MSDQEKMRISTADGKQLSQFIKEAIVTPMENKVTGSVTIHFLDGEIRGVEIKQHTKVLSKITFFQDIK